VWRTFLRAHASITRQMEHDLAEQHMLPLPSYDVLLQLAESPQRRLRMTDLADRVLLSRSGLTRLVDRMAADGLVVRESCSSDARGMFTVLTDAGLCRLRQTAPTHLRGIEDYMTSRLAPSELDTLRELLGRLLPPVDREPPVGGCGAAEGVIDAEPGDCGFAAATDPVVPGRAADPADGVGLAG
jgi:DNA-binding MarR family transcriptional regulator